MFRTGDKNRLLLGLLLVLFTLVLYSRVLRHGFVNYDDDRYITSNPQVQAGLKPSTISWAFTTFEQANWHPLTWLSHAFDCQLFHLHPAGHHLSSTVLHSTNALLLFLILQWFTGYTGRSLLVAAFFAVHPLNVESVAWVAERKSLLSMLFFLLAVAAYGWYVRKPRLGTYLAVAGLFAAGLMSKPMVITLPFVLLLLDYWPFGRMRLGQEPQARVYENEIPFASDKESVGRLIAEKVPLFLLSAVSAIITLIAQRAGGAVVSLNKVSVPLRLGNALVSYGLYLKKMVWPSGLAVLYPHPHSLPIWQVAAAAFFLILVTCLVLKYHGSRYLLVGWLWYLGTMIPMIGIVQVGNQAMADRYAYLPLIGPFIAIVWAVADWAKTLHLEAKYPAAAGFGVLVGLSWVTLLQLSYWQDDFKLWTHTLSINPRNFVAENNLGLAMMHQGRREEAILHFRAAAALEPADATSQLNLGIYAQEQNDLAQAKAHYEAVLQLTSDTQLRAAAYANLGTIYFALRDYRRAEQSFAFVVKLNRAFPIAIRDLGLIALKNGEDTEAVRYFAWLVTIDPSDINFFLLAQAFHHANRDSDAVWAYQRALALSKNIDETKENAAQLEAQ
jgi:protein O-mannosyl-transferase